MEDPSIHLDLQHGNGLMEENVSLSHFLTNVILPGDAIILHCDNGKDIHR